MMFLYENAGNTFLLAKKQKGIDEIIRYFGIKLEETMAFGDGGNDITMLRHAAETQRC